MPYPSWFKVYSELHGKIWSENHGLFVISLEYEKNNKREKKEKRKHLPWSLGVEVWYICFFLLVQHLLYDYVVIIYRINNILIGTLTMSLNLWATVLYTLLLPCSSASPEDGAPLFDQDLKNIMPHSEIFKPPQKCCHNESLSKFSWPPSFTSTLKNLGAAICSFALKSWSENKGNWWHRRHKTSKLFKVSWLSCVTQWWHSDETTFDVASLFLSSLQSLNHEKCP